jgi:hypothetical protein
VEKKSHKKGKKKNKHSNVSNKAVTESTPVYGSIDSGLPT